RLILFQSLATTAGFFGNTQFFHDENNNYCFNLTSVGLVLSEKEEKLSSNKIINLNKKKIIRNKENYTLFNIIENLQREFSKEIERLKKENKK
ncbi:MAG: hypothetical protein PHF26_02845, partial [Candidatus Gracilibacteria bacterium]|nr:hypothetical protein [Candidatus Gracilibacteria bacterium]